MLARRLVGAGGGAGTSFAPPPKLTPWATLTPTKSGSNPTLNIAGGMPNSIVKVGSTYYMCYTHYTSGSNDNDVRLAHSSSASGTWTDDGVILTLGSQAWELADRANNAWLMEDGGTFYLFYASNSAGSGETPGIGLATATTVTGTYTKYAGNPIVSPTTGTGAWDSRRVQEPSVIKVGSTWIMAAMAEDEDIAKGASEKVGIWTATAATGPWTPHPSNPVVGFGSGWDGTGAADPGIFYYNGYYWMTYAGLAGASGALPWRIGLAYATDPLGTWTKFTGNPILDLGSGGSFDDTGVWRGSLYIENDVLTLVYAGYPAAGLGSAKGGSASIAVS